jgi:hypothetical protein
LGKRFLPEASSRNSRLIGDKAYPMGIPHRELPRLRPRRLPSDVAQAFMRPASKACVGIRRA